MSRMNRKRRPLESLKGARKRKVVWWKSKGVRALIGIGIVGHCMVSKTKYMNNMIPSKIVLFIIRYVYPISDAF